jgi:hypothetical protein
MLLVSILPAITRGAALSPAPMLPILTAPKPPKSELGPPAWAPRRSQRDVGELRSEAGVGEGRVG